MAIHRVRLTFDFYAVYIAMAGGGRGGDAQEEIDLVEGRNGEHPGAGRGVLSGRPPITRCFCREKHTHVGVPFILQHHAVIRSSIWA
ncbi:MAG: hypothetical protein CXX83_02400, partial [Methanobacteriota archaeon]